ncbi:hypothetical protein Pmar_PMAR021043 [Perkinsus marinus ATCC 50983]|uniref:Pumilio domain member 4 n=1 Tax=Perkinsus marinus (strain ATCC 50983 / TXsc) TaxID=423536 RepID=C5KG89_PERM5|nr:hypothetical protein Pmar_PMAR021043 [Perkinsus marinus ATCC 50983]EER16445.1 hypothetical protein Pmar_PMAR021043 [Perkinsus marinus ATCC 50983]|eukprot:XP_002784649.1 hypothetical protein Pmar_PMAR021043 [Perkinsus marinus ATCC 50983]
MPVGDAAKELFMYNRENWKFNTELRQKNIYQQQKMRVRQVDLYRQDLRDLFGLTILKMDNYLIMNTILLVLTIEMFYKGRAPELTPNWLFWPYAITMGAAIVNLALSIWLSLHASVYAQVFSVRSLTQWLRLPVPSAQEVADGAARLKDFESNGVTSFLRVPVILEQVRDKAHTDLPEPLRTKPSSLANGTPEKGVRDLTTDWEVFLAHFNLFNLMHAKWQGHEAYSRVTMCWGTNQMLFAFAYFTLAFYGVFFGNRIAAYAFVLIMTLCSYIHIGVNTVLSDRERIVMMTLSFGAVVTQSVAVGWHDINVSILQTSERSEVVVLVTTPAEIWIGISGVVLSMFWQAFFIYLCQRDADGLPYKFSTVWCIDVLGFGVEAIQEVAEPMAQPRLSEKGHLKLPSIPMGGPSNDYRTARDYDEVLPFVAAEADDGCREYDISEELRRACRRCERSLDRLFRYWDAQRQDLSNEDKSKLDELKSQFEVQRIALAAALEAEQGRGDATPGTPFNPVGGWVTLEHVTETGETLPYHLNTETGEIQWDTSRTLGLRRGMSLLPDELAELMARTRALQEAHKAQGLDILNDPRTTVRRARMPFMFTRLLNVTILLCWAVAVVVLAINTVDPELIADGLLDIPIAAIPVDNHTDDHHRLLARREGWSLVRLETGVNSVARDGNVVYVATLFSAYILNKTTLHEIDCGTSGVTVIDDLLVLNGGVWELFKYNRTNYQFDYELNQDRVYHTQKMRVEQVDLYREDVRDLFELTIGKMDTYIVVNTLTLGFVVGFFYEGRLPEDGTPAWLVWLWGMHLICAIFFLLLSVWFAIHASIVAQTFKARVLTQWMRLPIPGEDEINPIAARLQDYETSGVKRMFRIPVVGYYIPGKKYTTGVEAKEAFPAQLNTEDPDAAEYNVFVEHFYLYNKLQEHWNGFDAYARVCMVLGANQFLHVISYMGLAYYMVQYHFWGTWVFVVLPMAFALAHERMNLLLNPWEQLTLAALQIIGPFLAGLCASFTIGYNMGQISANEAIVAGEPVDTSYETYLTAVNYISPVSYIIHMLCIGYLMSMAVEPDGSLPTKFSTVIQIDVLGLKKDEEEEEANNTSLESRLDASRKKSAAKLERAATDLIPQAPMVKHAQSIRKLKSSRHNMDSFASEGSQISQEGGARITRQKTTLPLHYTEETHERITYGTEEGARVPRSLTQDVNELASGRPMGLLAGEGDNNETFAEANTKAMTLPWRSFKAGAGVITLLWLWGIIYAFIVASGTTTWGWNNKLGLVVKEEPGETDEDKEMAHAGMPRDSEKLRQLQGLNLGVRVQFDGEGTIFNPVSLTLGPDDSLLFADMHGNSWSASSQGGRVVEVNTGLASKEVAVDGDGVYRYDAGKKIGRLPVPSRVGVSSRLVGACEAVGKGVRAVTKRGDVLSWDAAGKWTGLSRIEGVADLTLRDCVYDKEGQLLVLGASTGPAGGEAEVWTVA